MRRARFIPLLLLLLALATVGLLVVQWATASDTPPSSPFWWPQVICAAVRYTQLSLAGVWLVLGRTSGPLRLLGVATVVAVWSTVWLLFVDDSAGLANWLAANSLMLLCAAAGMLVLRLSGMRIIDLYQPDDPPTRPYAPRQFSILYLLGWITVVAIVLGVAKYLLAGRRVSPGLVDQWEDLAFLGGQTAITVVTVWAVLSTVAIQKRVLGLVVCIALAYGANSVAFTHDELPVAALFPALEALLLAAVLVVIRVLGFRLVKGSAAAADRSPAGGVPTGSQPGSP